MAGEKRIGRLLWGGELFLDLPLLLHHSLNLGFLQRKLLDELFDAGVRFVLRRLHEFLCCDARLLKLTHLLLMLGDQLLLPLRYPGAELGNRQGGIAEVRLGGFETSVAVFDLRGGISKLSLKIMDSSPQGGELFCVFLVVEAPLRRKECGGFGLADHRLRARRLLYRLLLKPAGTILHGCIFWSSGRG